MRWTTGSDTTSNSIFYAGGFMGGGGVYIRFGTNAPPRQRRIERPPQKPQMHPCAVLGVPCNAPLQQVKSAFRRLAKTHHPDLGGDVEKMAEINAAYGMLVNR